MGDAVAYLDYNASAPLRPAALDAMTAAAVLPGNPSSVHGPGRAARRMLEDARAIVANAVNAKAPQVIFTSGGTEANNLAVLGLGASVLYGATEHDAVRAPAQARGGLEIAVDCNGMLDLDLLEDLLKSAPKPALVAVMLANNESGVIAAIAGIAAVVHGQGGLMHCDAVQALGKIPVDIKSLGVDALSLSAHKIGGPKGVGALIVRDGLTLKPLLIGGGQESRRRAGTENLMGIAGFAAAVEAMAADDWQRVRQLRDALEAEVVARIPAAVVVAQGALRLPNTTCLALAGAPSETQVMAMDLAGIALSAGAACSSGKVAVSHVLAAMGQGRDVAAAAIRISLGWSTTAAEVSRFVTTWTAFAGRRQRAGAAA